MKAFLLAFSLFAYKARAQNYELKSVGYNAVIGSLSGGIGAIINKKPEEKWGRTFVKGFLTGAAGGLLVYGGKKLNYEIGSKPELGYAWLSRIVFSAGNSIVENASANIPALSRGHFDIGFIRLEFQTAPFSFAPKLMLFALGTTTFMAVNGNLDLSKTLSSGTLVFTTPMLRYAPQFAASSPGNGIMCTTGLTGPDFYKTFGHEMIHTFQFQELSGFNYFLKPVSYSWRTRSERFQKFSKWIYADFNYPLALGNYFWIQGGYKSGYKHNFLENEAEFLSTGQGPK